MEEREVIPRRRQGKPTKLCRGLRAQEGASEQTAARATTVWTSFVRVVIMVNLRA